MTSFQLRIHRCLCLLVLSMIFEGVARKLAPQSVGILIFFFKDLVAVVLLFLCLTGKPNPEASRWLGVMGKFSALLVPCILLTAVNDPVLAVFGAKQYILFPIVAVAMCAAYVPNHRRELFSFFRLIVLSLFVTTLVAVAQNRLPADNWLNLSVAGDDLSGFSAGGYLRVSSTFSFVGQYCFYLNAMCYCLPVYFYFNKFFHGWAPNVQTVVLIGLTIVATFVTGSRASVIGNATMLSVGGLLAAFCGGGRGLIKIIAALIVGALLLLALQSLYPEFFAAYQARVEGHSESSHTVEIEKRVIGGLLDWTDGWEEAPPSLFGYGLGAMSNGSEKISAYAARWRDAGFWTETDQATTFFEGGWYLVLVWYGFRFWVVIHSLTLVLKLRDLEYRFIGCLAWGFISIIGLQGTLSIQPPLSIWWWLAVGLIICLGHFDRGQPGKKQTQDFNLNAGHI